MPVRAWAMQLTRSHPPVDERIVCNCTIREPDAHASVGDQRHADFLLVSRHRSMCGGFMRQRLAMTGLLCGLVIGLAPILPARAADPATDQRIKALEARMAELEKRLGVYESTPPAPTAAAVAPPAAASPVANAPPPPPPKPISAGDWSGLHRGMGERAVTTLLGRPQSKQITSVSETWFYDGDRRVGFDRDGKVDNWSQP